MLFVCTLRLLRVTVAHHFFFILKIMSCFMTY